MFGITDAGAFLLGTIAIVLLPGPNSLYVLTVAAQRGRRAAWLGGLGIMVGDSILMLLSAAGMASLLRTSPLLFGFFKFAGAAYLAWIGLQMIAAVARPDHQVQGVSDGGRVEDAAPFVTALKISLLNPKAILFFISFFVQFVDPAYPYPVLTFTALALIVQGCSAAYLAVLISVGSALADRLRRQPVLASMLSATVGLLFLGLSLKLAMATAH